MILERNGIFGHKRCWKRQQSPRGFAPCELAQSIYILVDDINIVIVSKNASNRAHFLHNPTTTNIWYEPSSRWNFSSGGRTDDIERRR
eukprot:2452129-Pleurochrysis_carterae.AAC.1